MGRLDWDCSEKTDEDKAKAGKRYEGKHVLINLESGSILDCKVLEVSINGFLVEPYSISGLADNDDDDEFDWDMPIPYSKFFHVFLAP